MSTEIETALRENNKLRFQLSEEISDIIDRIDHKILDSDNN